MPVSTQDSILARLFSAIGSFWVLGIGLGMLLSPPMIWSRNNWNRNTTTAASNTRTTVLVSAPVRVTLMPWASRLKPMIG